MANVTVSLKSIVEYCESLRDPHTRVIVPCRRSPQNQPLKVESKPAAVAQIWPS